MSRQAYYQQRHAETARLDRDRQVAALVREVRRRQPRIGGRKLHHMLATSMGACGIKLGRDALFATLKRENLLVPPARAFHKTTNILQAPEFAQVTATASAAGAALGCRYHLCADTRSVRLPQFGDRCILAQNRGLSRASDLANRGGCKSAENGTERPPDPLATRSSF